MSPSDGDEGFLRRWSRMKRAVEAEKTDVPAPASAVPATTLSPAPDPQPPPGATAFAGLDFSSDFSAFLQPRVEEAVKRAALKKLFHSPHFNQMDGLDVYIDDYSQFEPISEELVQQLAHARSTLFGAPLEESGDEPAVAGNVDAPSVPARDAAGAGDDVIPPHDGDNPAREPGDRS